MTSAYQELPEGREEGVPQHDKAVRSKTRSLHLLRDGEQAGEGQVEECQGAERVPQEEAQAVRLRAKNGQIAPSVRVVNGKKERRCTGPAHSEPTWLPDTDKYFYTRKSGKYAGQHISRCRLCSAWRAGLSLDESGYVPASAIKPFLIEGINRVGIMEFCRRAKIMQRTAWSIRHGQRRVTRTIAKRIMLEVVSLRRKNEVRHRDSIKAGTTVRGLPEKEVTSHKDLYEPESEEQRQERKAAVVKQQQEKRDKLTDKQREEVRQKDRERKRRGRKDAKTPSV